MKVLLVDDELDICDFLQEYLDIRGITGIIANSIEEALPILKEQTIDIIFLDNNLRSETKGVEILPEFKSLQPHCKIFMLTADSSEDLKNQAIMTGASGVIVKPFSFESFDSAIDGVG